MPYEAASLTIGRTPGARRRWSAVRAAPFNEWLDRSLADLHMMLTDTPHGPLPVRRRALVQHPVRPRRHHHRAAGSVDRARDRARRARLPGRHPGDRRRTPTHDAEPGKILHETRSGEMAALGEVPFGRYYGSVDATPLFVMLAGAYCERTGDRAFIARSGRTSSARSTGSTATATSTATASSSTRGAPRRAWCTRAGRTRTTRSSTPTARWPTARSRSCEVQGYVYAARLAAAAAGPRAGRRTARADALRQQAERLRERFERGVLVRGAGHLRAGARRREAALPRCGPRTPATACSAASPPRRARAASPRRCSAPESFSGWGIRTLAAAEARYNPMSYHNGSVWPHDNALIAAGFARYGFTDLLRRALDGPVRRQPLRRPAPAARAVLRLPPPAGRGADALPGRLRAAGLGGGRGLPAAAGLPGPAHRRGQAPRGLPAPDPARVAGRGLPHRPPPPRGLRGPGGRALRPRRLDQRHAAEGGVEVVAYK